MKKIWQKWNQKSNPIIEKYNTGDDYLFDMVIMPFDIKASKAHAKMLGSIWVLSKSEVLSLTKTLDELLDLFNKNKIKINIEDEDCHTVIENFLTKKLGEIGKKIHTWRSRNDQVLVAVRLYTIDKLVTIQKALIELIENFISFASKNENIVIPWYTHTQQAMLSTISHWAFSFVEWLINDFHCITDAIELNNKNPLGTAAGFWVNFPLDRDMTKKDLWFKENIINSLYAQASRWKFESYSLESLSQIMLTLCRFASDMLFFTSRELNFFKIDESLTTWSSIMPQKKNLDSMELIRWYTSIVISNQLTSKNIVKWTLSWYNRDLQLLKKPLIESLNITFDSILVVNEFIKNISVIEENINKTIQKDIIAADIANELVEKKLLSFRDAYIKVWNDLSSIKNINYLDNIKSKKSLWSPWNINIEYYKKALKELKSIISN